jgi:hypothetical protein
MAGMRRALLALAWMGWLGVAGCAPMPGANYVGTYEVRVDTSAMEPAARRAYEERSLEVRPATLTLQSDWVAVLRSQGKVQRSSWALRERQIVVDPGGRWGVPIRLQVSDEPGVLVPVEESARLGNPPGMRVTFERVSVGVQRQAAR